MKSIFTILILLSSIAAIAQSIPENKVLLKEDMHRIESMAFFNVDDLTDIGDLTAILYTHYLFAVRNITPSITAYVCINCNEINYHYAYPCLPLFESLFQEHKLIGAALDKGYIFSDNESLIFFNLSTE